MLKIGDPGPNEKYEGKEVDFDQFMHIMEMANLIKPENTVGLILTSNGMSNHPDDLGTL